MKPNVQSLNRASGIDISQNLPKPGTSFGDAELIDSGAVILKKPAKKSRNNLRSNAPTESDQQSSVEQITDEQRQREKINYQRRQNYILNVEAKQTYKMQQMKKQIEENKKKALQTEESDDSVNEDADKERMVKRESQEALERLESIPMLNFNTKGIWSREANVDFAKLQRRLSSYGLFGLDHDLRFPPEKKENEPGLGNNDDSRSPTDLSNKQDEVGNAMTSIAARRAATQQRRLDMMKLDLVNCITAKFRVEKIDAGFKAKITENANFMFEKVIKEFAAAQKVHDDNVAQQQQQEQAKRDAKMKEIETGQKVPKLEITVKEVNEPAKAKEEQKHGQNKEEKNPEDANNGSQEEQVKAGQEPQPPDKNIDKTVVKEGKADIEKGKELNSLEIAFLKEHNLLKKDLQLENLRHETIAGSILLKLFKEGDKDALETFAKIIQSTTTNKQKMRGIVFKEDYGDKSIIDIEANFAENKYRKQAKIQLRKEKRARMRRLYSDRYDSKHQTILKDIESGNIKVDKFGNPIKDQDKSGDAIKITEPPTEYSSHSSDVHQSDEESSEVSSFDSESSRINFWRDINTRDEDYTNAVIVSNNKANIQADQKDTNFLKEMQERQATPGTMSSPQPQSQKAQMPTQAFQSAGSGGNSFSPSPKPMAIAPPQDARPSKAPNVNKQFKQDLKKQQFEIKNYQKDIKALQMKIEKMKQSHDLEKKNIKQIALTYAIDYFKQKTQQLVKLFTNESMKLLQQYSYLRDQLFQRDEILKRCARYTIMQEEAIMELRSFIERNMNDIVKAMMSQNAGEKPFKAPYLEGYGGDGKPSFDRMLSDDPDHLFDLYTSIIHDNNASDQYAIIVELKAQIVDLQDQINALNEELKAYNKSQEIWLSDKAGMENQLKQETAMVAKLQEELAAMLVSKNNRIRELEDLVICNKTTFENDKARLNALHEHECKVHNLILVKYEKEYDNMKKQFRQVKNVLRIPRLNSEYQALMKEIKDDKQLEVYLKSDLIKKSKEIEPEGFDSISACLKMQFTKELDIENLKYEVLKNIDIKTYDLEFGSENPKYNKKNFQFKSYQWTEQATKRTKDSIYAGQTESNQQSKHQDLSYLIHSLNSRRIYNNSNDPNNPSFEKEFLDLRKKNITQNQSNTRPSQIPQNTDIFIQNSEEITNGRQNINNLILGTSRVNTNRSNNQKFKQQLNLTVADQSILSSGSTDQQQEQEFSNFMTVNDIQGGFSQTAAVNQNKITMEDLNQVLISGASIESKQVEIKHNPKYESVNFKRNVRTQGGARNQSHRETNKYFTQRMNLNMVPNINNFRLSMPQKEIESKNDLLKQNNKHTIQTYHDLLAIEDGITSPDLVHINTKYDQLSPLSVRGFKQPVSPSHMNVAIKGIKEKAQWHNRQKFIHISTPPDQRRDAHEDQVFNSTNDIIKSTNRINLRNSQHNNLKKVAQKLSPDASPDSRQFQGLRLQSMSNEQRNQSTEKTSNIVSQNLSGFKPISSQNMTIELQSTSEQRKSINAAARRVVKKPDVSKLVQKQTGFMSQRQLQWDNVNRIEKR